MGHGGAGETAYLDSVAGGVQDRVLSILGRAYERLKASGVDARAFEILPPGGSSVKVGDGEPAFVVMVQNGKGLSALNSLDEHRIAGAYMDGNLDIVGDVEQIFPFRDALTDRHPLLYAWYVYLQPKLFGQVRCDEQWIAKHYDEDPEFYYQFLDKKVPAYSHAVFEKDDEPLSVALERKMDFALRSCRIRPGDRVLDIGTGWGAFAEFAGERGVRVVSITLSRKSEECVSALIRRKGLSCEVRREHFFDHVADEPYDAIVNMGVTEHLSDYRRSLAHYARLLKPGGRVFIDASAARTKFSFSSFVYRSLFPGNVTPLAIGDYLAAVNRSSLELIAVYNDRENYRLTLRHWATNLDRARQEIVSHWGEKLYRKFRLYLWGSVYAMKTELLSAFRIVMEKSLDRAPVSRWA